ncbi:molybdopterin-dependent oxidoreductase [Aureimonas sp. ME7]|uniref:molybdopterin-dependent oxidoreductase n=1 Tax=Aureimonas sp. ME7 TaxID=2744252 RepID=UPI0015FDFABC|nr:molybdopterin-dependent oxidoreductase [Aureimonas sp. ME7]
MLSRRAVLFSVACLGGVALSARRATANDDILRLTGSGMPGGMPVGLTLAALDALPRTSFRTSTPWHPGVVEFSGVSLRDCLRAAGAQGQTLRLVALNDYVVEADLAELEAADALLATRQDGEPMPISDKGPIFLVFPFDARPALQHQSFYSRSVWQLAEVQIQP